MTAEAPIRTGDHQPRPPASATREHHLPTGTHILERSLVIDRPRDDVFRFFASAENLGVITPPELRFEILNDSPIDMGVGSRIDYRIRLYGMPMTWRTLIERWEPPQLFEDIQLRGPYRMWRHRHQFDEVGEGKATRMVDTVWYRLPVLGPFNALVHPLVRRQLDRIFDYRAEAVRGAFKGSYPS